MYDYRNMQAVGLRNIDLVKVAYYKIDSDDFKAYPSIDSKIVLKVIIKKSPKNVFVQKRLSPKLDLTNLG